MIYEDDLDQAIIEANAERDPNAWTAIRLAAFYILKWQMFGKPEQIPVVAENATGGYSYAAAPMLRGAGISMADAPQPIEEIVSYSSKTEFGQAIDGRRAADLWPVLDELMSILQTMHPRLYTAAMDKIK